MSTIMLDGDDVVVSFACVDTSDFEEIGHVMLRSRTGSLLVAFVYRDRGDAERYVLTVAPGDGVRALTVDRDACDLGMLHTLVALLVSPDMPDTIREREVPRAPPHRYPET